MTGRLTSKRVVFALVAGPALLLLLGGTRTWLVGRSAEPLLGGGPVAATGSELVPGVVALALVALVALVTALTGGRAGRRVSAAALLLASVGAVALALGPLRGPEVALGRVAASGLGRTGVVQTTASPTGWAWLSLVSAVLLVLASGLVWAAAGRWGGLSSRFEAPVDAAHPPVAGGGHPGGGGERHGAAGPHGASAPGRRTAWDELSEGRDPTEAATSPDERRPT